MSSATLTRAIHDSLKFRTYSLYNKPTGIWSQFKYSQSQSKYFSTTPSAMTAKLDFRLKYFNFRVLGEPIRWQFALARVPFEDQRLARDITWDEEFKNKTGWGRLPILVIDGNIEITQSCAISRYLAKEFGTLPESDLLQARCDELVDNLQDLRMLWRPWVRETDASKKLILEKEMKEVHFPFYLQKVEAFVAANGKGGFAIGNKLTWADLYLANFLEIWTDNHGQDLLNKYPLLKQQRDKILNIPQIKEWNDKRPQSKI